MNQEGLDRVGSGPGSWTDLRRVKLVNGGRTYRAPLPRRSPHYWPPQLVPLRHGKLPKLARGVHPLVQLYPEKLVREVVAGLHDPTQAYGRWICPLLDLLYAARMVGARFSTYAARGHSLYDAYLELRADKPEVRKLLPFIPNRLASFDDLTLSYDLALGRAPAGTGPGPARSAAARN